MADDYVSKEALNAVLQKVMLLENKVESIQTDGTPAQAEAVRKLVSDIPETFEINARMKSRSGKLVRKKITLDLQHPSLYKLEMIGTLVEQISGELRGGLQSDMSIPNFVLKLLANKKIQAYFYKILQIAFDPLPDPTDDELSIPTEHIKLLDPVRVIDVLIKRSTPFFLTMLSTLQLGRPTE